MSEEIQPEPQNKSTRSYEDWKNSLLSIIAHHDPSRAVIIKDEQVKPYYDQGLMPTVAFNQLIYK